MAIRTLLICHALMLVQSLCVAYFFTIISKYIVFLQNMILGGSDTTMATLTWAISLLLNNRHVLKRAQDELDAEVGRERIVSESDISKLVYIQAIVKETLRLYPVVPLSAQHEFTDRGLRAR